MKVSHRYVVSGRDLQTQLDETRPGCKRLTINITAAAAPEQEQEQGAGTYGILNTAKSLPME
jgi:hypothetical protein